MDVSRKKHDPSREATSKAGTSKDTVVLRTKRSITKANNEHITNGCHTPVKEKKIYRSQCPCESHFPKILMEKDYDMEVDRLFDLIFGSNDFVRIYREAQNFMDQTETEWELNPETNCRARTLTYKLPCELAFIGKSTIFTREAQIITHEIPGSHYVVETEVSNQGVKFGDTFCLIIRYCLVQISAKTTHLRVTAQVDYRKSVNGLVKHIIEHNAYSASQEGLKDLNNRLIRILHLQSEKRRSISEEGSSLPAVIEQNPHPVPDTRQTMTYSNAVFYDTRSDLRPSNPDKLTQILIVLVFALFMIHFYLYMKLSHVDFILNTILQPKRR